MSALFGAVLLATQACWSSTVIDVFPTSTFPDDVIAVQAAVDTLLAGNSDGIINLHAMDVTGAPAFFDFGLAAEAAGRGSVIALNGGSGSLEFRGISSGRALPKIIGGNVPLYVERPQAVVVQGIEFERPYRFAIRVARASGSVSIEDNVIRDVDGEIDAVSPMARAITVGPGTVGNVSIDGPVIIRGNTIRGASALFTDAISLLGIDGPVIVTNNVIEDVNVGVRMADGRRLTLVSGNEISVFVPGEGLVAIGVQYSSAWDADGRPLIATNTIEAVDKLDVGTATGVTLFACDSLSEGDARVRNALVVANEIALDSAYAGMQLLANESLKGCNDVFAAVSQNRLVSNTLTGTARYGVALQGTAATELIQNRLINDMALLTPSAAHYMLDQATRDNFVVIRAGEIVEDLGTGNTILVTTD
ncbi:MAG: hypothetical protein AAGA68_21605 [Pseudomonadota bacterium]